MSQTAILLDLTLLVVGVALLVAGGETLVRGAVAMAARLGVSPLLIGLTVVAFGTSAPELALNVVAAFNDNSELSFGNIVGSNIANIGLILGISCLIKPMRVRASLVRREIPIMLVATGVFIALGYAPPNLGEEGFGLSRVEGALLLAGFVGFCGYMYVLSRSSREESALLAQAETPDESAAARTPLWRSNVLFVVGLAMLLGGGKLTELGAVGVAASLGMSNELIGLTVVAVATSLPELATSLAAAHRGQIDIAVGNVVGSNIFNILLVMGATSMISPVPLPPLAMGSFIVMGGLSLALLPMSVTGGRFISRFEGVVLLLVYFGYLGYEVVNALASRG